MYLDLNSSYSLEHDLVSNIELPPFVSLERI